MRSFAPLAPRAAAPFEFPQNREFFAIYQGNPFAGAGVTDRPHRNTNGGPETRRSNRDGAFDPDCKGRVSVLFGAYDQSG
jgi:hypothetical protein